MALTKILIMIVIALSPFEFAMTVGGVGSLLKILILCALVSWMGGTIYRTSRCVVSLSIIEKLWIFYLLLVCFSLLWASDLSRGIDYTFSIGLMVFLMIAIANIEWNDSDLSKIILGIEITMFAYELLMVLSPIVYMGTAGRYSISIFGKTNDPNNVAGYFVFSTVFGLYEVTKGKLRIVFGLIQIALSVYCLLKTGSRGGLIAVCVCFVSYLILATFCKKKQWKLLLIVPIIAIVISFIVNNMDAYLLERLFKNDYMVDSGSGRIEIWRTAFDIISNHFLFGIGIGSFSSVLGTGVHNNYLLILCENGIIGFVSFYIPVMKCLIFSLKQKEFEIFSILMGELFVIMFLDAYNKKFFWSAIMLALIAISKNKSMYYKDYLKGEIW